MGVPSVNRSQVIEPIVQPKADIVKKTEVKTVEPPKIAVNNQSLSDTQNAKSGIDTTQYGKNLISSAGQVKTAEVKPAKLNERTVGEDKSGDLKKGMITQLRNESVINQANSINTNNGYSQDLKGLADGIEKGSLKFQKGTYKSLELDVVRLSPAAGNAVPSPTYSGSPDQARQRVERFDQDLRNLDNQIATQQAIIDRPFSGNPIERVKQVKQKADAGVQLVNLNVQKVNMNLDKMGFINAARLNSSRTADNTVNQAVADGVDPKRTPVIFVNGFNTDVNRSGLQALELSKTLNSPVNHVVNVSSIISFAKATTGIVGEQLRSGRFSNGDLQNTDQRIQQHLVGNRPAAATTANLILNQLYDPNLRKAKAPVKIVGYSQGAPIAAQAIRDVESHLTQQVANKKITAQEKKEFLDRIRLVGVGAGAAERHIDQKFVNGRRQDIPALKDIKYRIIYDREDPITQIVGVTDNALDRDDLNGRVKTGITGLVEGRISPHLSYFKGYEYTDPGSSYNARAGQELNRWFSGQSLNGTVDIRN